MADKLDILTEQLQRRLFVELEASGRHVHVTKAQALQLFGHDLTPARALTQPDQYLANERVSVVGPKGKFDGVAVLGPCRSEGQVEISLTDAKSLGLAPPVRLSGDIKNTPGAVLVGPHGTVNLDCGVIAAMRHIHMTPEDAALQNVTNGDMVRLKVMTARPLIFEKVAVRVSPKFQTYAHLDYDEANACEFKKGDLGMILK